MTAAHHALHRLGADPQLLRRLERQAADLGGVPRRVARADRINVRVSDGRAVVSTDPDASRVTDPDTGLPALPVVGDWVVVTRDDPPAVLEVLERRGRLVRRDPGRPGPQLLAANVDVVVITVPMDRDVVVARVERELVVALAADAAALVVLTKVDAVASTRAAREALAVSLAGAAPLEVSAVDGHGVTDVAEHLGPGRTAVLLGPSGAGKSTLTNALLGRDVQAVGGVRPGDRKGRHITASRGLHALPSGGALIDTPGLRAVGLWDAHQGLARAFPEITRAAAACRFRDCSHTDEPACGVREAVQERQVAADRLERYLGLAAELAEADEEAARSARIGRRRADRRAP